MFIFEVGFVVFFLVLCGFVGGVFGGIVLDILFKKGCLLIFVRKVLIIVGMLLFCSMVVCNYIDLVWFVVVIMLFVFFGKGFGVLGWVVVFDMFLKECVGLSGGLFNMFGNIVLIIILIIIGYIVNVIGFFNGVFVFVGVNVIVVIFSYLLLVGLIKWVVLKK